MRRKRGPFLVALACVAVFLTVVLVTKLSRNDWGGDSNSSSEPPTLVFQREDLQRIWKWEIASGHYPSTQSSASFDTFSLLYGLCAQLSDAT